MAILELTESMDEKCDHALWSTGKEDTQSPGP